LFDFCHRNNAEDDAKPEIDLKEDLKAANRDYFDVVGFTHAELGSRHPVEFCHGCLGTQAVKCA
jgi:hypothetical protein